MMWALSVVLAFLALIGSAAAQNTLTTQQLGLTNANGARVTIQADPTSTTYNYNFPTSAGTAGQLLASQGGGSTAMSWVSSSAGAGNVNSGTAPNQLAYYPAASATVGPNINATITAAGNISLQPSATSATAFQIRDTTAKNIFKVDTASFAVDQVIMGVVNQTSPPAFIGGTLGPARLFVYDDSAFLTPIQGVMVNTLAGNPVNFPTAITANCYLNSAGNNCFGFFGATNIYSAGNSSHEFDAFNWAGAPSAALPPVYIFGTTSVNSTGLLLGAGGTFNSTVGLVIAQEGGHPQKWLTGIYLTPACCTTNGVVVDTTGLTGSAFKSTGFSVDGSGNLIAKSVSTLTGADPTGVADSAPAFRAAMASNKVLIVPPGTYLFKTTQSPPCCSFDNTAVLVQSLSNFTISGYGAKIVIDPSIALSSAFHFDQDTNFQVLGLTINGSRSGLSDGQENVAITLTSDVNFHVSDIHVGTGFNAFNGAAFAGDWLVNGVIDNIQMDSIGICYDFAYLLHMKIGQTYAKGQSTTSLLGDKCFSVIVDGPNSANNHTGVSFTATDDVLVTGVDASNFNTAALLVTGTHYTLTGNSWHDNPGQGSTPGIGVYIAYNPPGGSSSAGAPPANITISGDKFFNNGTTITGWGLLIDTGNISNSDTIANIAVTGSLFDNNKNTGIGDQLTAHTSNFTEVGNIFSGANQTTDVVTNFKTTAGFSVDGSGNVTSKTMPNVINLGAKCDGATDDTAAINAALTANIAVVVPSATCVSSTGITVPAGHTLQGASFSAPSPATGVGTSIIQCPRTLAGACITLGTLSSNASSSLKGITVAGTAGTPSSSSTGVLILDGQQVTISDVLTYNFDFGFHWQAHPSTGSGLASTCTRCYSGSIRVSHIWQDSWPELFIDQSRFGQNGANDIAGADYIRISGGVGGTASGPNGLFVTNTQFNHGGGGAANALINLLSLGVAGVGPIDAGEFHFTNVHVENLADGIISDASWNIIRRVKLTNFQFNTAVPFWALNAGTTPSAIEISNSIFAGTFALAPTGGISGLLLSNSEIDGAFSLVGTGGNTAAISNNTFVSTVSLTGAWTNALSFVGNYVGGAFTNTATGSVLVSDPKAGFSSTGFSVDGSGNAVLGASTSSATGTVTALRLEQPSTAASTNKNLQLTFSARDTVNTLKTVATIQTVPATGDNLADDLVFSTRNADVVAEAGRFKAAGDLSLNAHIRTNGSAPALTSCGSSPAILGDDKAGLVTMGTGTPTGCIITFNVAYTSAPYCTVSWQATPLASQSYVVSASAITLTQTATSSNKVNYTCFAQSGG